MSRTTMCGTIRKQYRWKERRNGSARIAGRSPCSVFCLGILAEVGTDLIDFRGVVDSVVYRMQRSCGEM